MSNRQRIRRHATNGNGRGQLVETIPEGIESDYYDQIVRCEGVRMEGESLILSEDTLQHLANAWAVLAGIRGYFRPAEHAEFCRSCDEAMCFIDYLTDKIIDAKPHTISPEPPS